MAEPRVPAADCREARAARWGVTLALLGLIALATGCRHGAETPRALPPNIDTMTFISEGFDAQGTLILGTRQGVFRSVDAGNSWHATAPRVFGATGAAYTSGSTIVARGRLFQRGDLAYDRVYLPRRAPFGNGSVTAMAWLPGGKLYAAVQGGRAPLYLTLDSARTWYPRPSIGLPLDVTVVSMAAARVRGKTDTLYAAVGPLGLWRSLDGGVSWGHLPHPGPSAFSVATTPADWSRAVVATPVVNWSRDYGQTWHATSFKAVLLAGDPRNANVWFAIGEDQQLHVSTDGGKSW